MKITIVTTMRNEGAHLLEWVAHHRAAGVTDFLVYTNACEDGTEALLELLPRVHVVRQDDMQDRGDKPPQWRALRAAWDHPVVAASDWISCIDCDEFINVDKSLQDIPDLIERAGAGMILMPWRLFGHNGHAQLSSVPTTQRFTRAAAPDMHYPAICSYFKTLFRPAGPFRQLGVHRPKQKNPERHGVPTIRDGSGRPVPDALAANDGQIMHWGQPIARELVQLNHYSVRSAADFMVKRARGLPNHTDKPIDLTYWVERNFNTVEDASIAHMRPATAKVEAAFLAIPGVAEAQEVCRDWQAAKFSALMDQEDALKLFGRLLLAGGSEMLPRDVSMGLINAYRSLNA